MSFSTINRLVLVGRLTRDPEMRTLPSGQSVCGLRLACNGSRRDANGEYHERANYFDVSVFGVQGENVSRYGRRGRQLAIDGRLEWREWETAEGQRRQAVSIVADIVQFLDSAGSDRGEAGSDRGDVEGGDRADSDGSSESGSGEGSGSDSGEGEGDRAGGEEHESAPVAEDPAEGALVF